MRTGARQSTGHTPKKNPARQGLEAQIDATTIWAGAHARDGDGLR